jgi:hypothetical protein
MSKIDILEMCLRGWIADDLPQNADRRNKNIAILKKQINEFNNNSNKLKSHDK